MSFEPVELRTGDGLVLRGECRQGEPDWLVLVHDVGQDLDAWRPLIGLAALRGWSALALDLRGHGGSDDPWDADACVADVVLATTEARRRGARAVCVAGAGEGAIAALRAADESPPEALVLLSPGPVPEEHAGSLRAAGVSELIVVGSHSARDDEDARRVAELSIGPALRVGLPTPAHGTELLAGPLACQAIEHVAAFWEEQRYLAAAPPAVARHAPPGLEAVMRPER
jgi:pimeloyl-ACP methyl ester carboxylesterase